MHQDGCRLLEDLLQDPALEIPGNQGRAGEKLHPDRPKEMLTVLGPMSLKRGYFYQPASGGQAQGQGRCPLDEALGLIDGYTPGMAKMMCRAGAMASGYEAASADLKAYAGLEVEGRQIQRMVNLMADDIHAHGQKAEPFQEVKPVEVFYASVDGTGVPMMAEEVQGRAGKQEDGSAKTREVKLGCVFTQQSTDDEGQPLRDPASSTYVSSFACAPDFGPLIRAEALRRGMALATMVVLLGDGAAWIWEIARTCFPFAAQIVDFYHALEHLTALTDLLFGTKSVLSKEYQARWRAYLEVDQVAALIREANTWILQLGCEAKAAGKALGYFENNQSRMLYGTFRDKGYFIGSGVVEAGCKTVIGRRVKQSGMLWSLTGAGKVLAIRCAVMNHDFDGFWGQTRISSELKAAA
ncbi:MAG: ISKra4 family transposase [Limisphaerales bacterium]